MGGIGTAADAIEMIIAGANAVGVGTAIFRDPGCLLEIVEGIERYLDAHGIASVAELVNTVER